MTTVLLPDAAKKAGLTLDPQDAAPTIDALLERLPNGTLEEPSILELPESYRCVASIAPNAPAAAYRHLYGAAGVELHWPTLGPGHVEGDWTLLNEAFGPVSVKQLTAAHEIADRWRNRYLFGPTGGYGWKLGHLKLRGPKLDEQPERGPSAGPHSTLGGPVDSLEGQHFVWPRGVGDRLTDEQIAGGAYGLQLCAVDMAWGWTDYISPSSAAPNGPPCKEVHAFGGNWEHGGRMAFLASGVRGWSLRHINIGTTPSSIIHSETGHGTRLIGGGVVDSCKVRGGKDFWHISGDVAEFVGLTITRNERWDQEIGGRMMGGRRFDLGLGRARIRDIHVTENLHHRHEDGAFVGDYLRVDGINHTRNAGPTRKGYPISTQLRARDCRSATLAPNLYTNT